MKHQAVIAYNKRNEPEPICFNKHFVQTCVKEQLYRYGSCDTKYETLKSVERVKCISKRVLST